MPGFKPRYKAKCSTYCTIDCFGPTPHDVSFVINKNFSSYINSAQGTKS